VQTCLDLGFGERMKVIGCVRCVSSRSFSTIISFNWLLVCRGHIIELATNQYGAIVIQNCLDYEDEIKLLVISELFVGNPAGTLTDRYAINVWIKVCGTSVLPQIIELISGQCRFWG
jgi:hypothetical protein